MRPPGFSRALLVVPADGADQQPTFTPKALYVGVAGTLKVTTSQGDVIAFPAVNAGLLELQVDRVWSTGTSATGLVLLGDG